MVKLKAKHIALGKKLRKHREGKATSGELECEYSDIEPLIRRAYVRVESIAGVPIYVLTAAGSAWIANLD